MGYLTNGLSFKTLRNANLARVIEYKDGKGRLSHASGVDAWSAAEWLMALTGELGELANILKKVNRGDFTTDDVKKNIEDELADVVCYLDLLAARLDVDLSRAVENKFNEVSRRVKSSVFIFDDDWHRSDKSHPPADHEVE